MKKPLIKALGVILSAAMICGSVPAGVSPALAAEVTEGVSPAPVTEVSAEAAATNEVSVIDTGNEEKESDNSSTDPDEDATSVSGNAAEDETGEAASDDETELGEKDIFSLDWENASDETINKYLTDCSDEEISRWIQNLSDEDLADLMVRDTYLSKPLGYYGEDCDDCGLTNGKQYDTALDYYKVVASCKNVKKTFRSAEGSVNITFSGYLGNLTSSIKVSLPNYKTSNLSAKQQADYTVLGDTSHGLKITKQYNHKTCANVPKGDYYICLIDISFAKPAGYTISAPTYTTNPAYAGKKGKLYNGVTFNSDTNVYSADSGNQYFGTSNTNASTESATLEVDAIYNMGVGTSTTAVSNHLNIGINYVPVNYNAYFTGCSGVDKRTWTYDREKYLPAAPASPTVTLTYDTVGGSAVSRQTLEKSFAGWKLGNNVYAASADPGNIGYADVTFDAKWADATTNLPAAPKKTGYTFDGWSTLLGKKDAEASYTASDNETIKALWSAHSYTVNFVSDERDYGSQSFSYGSAQNLKTLADLQISKPGYTFKGWNGTYTDGQSVNNLTDVDNGTITLTAQWEAKTDTPYTVHRYVQKSLDNTDSATGYELYTAPEGTENPILGTETKTATTDTSVTEIAVAIPGYDTPDAIGPKTIAGDGSTTFDFYYNITDTRATLTVNHYYQTEIDGDWVLFDGTFNGKTVDNFTNVFHGTVGESMTPEQLSTDIISKYFDKEYDGYTLVPTETAPKTVVLTKNGEVNYYYKMVKKNTVVEYKVEHYIQKAPGGAYELLETTKGSAELGATVTPELNQKAIDAVNAIEGCKCEKPQLQVVTITQEGMVFKYNYACVKGTPDGGSGSAGSDLTDEAINEIAKKLAAGLSFKMDIDGVNYEIVQNPDGTLAIKFAATTDTKVVIPDVIKIGDKIYRITEVNEKAFKDNTTIREVVISQNVSKIGNSAFEGCTSLEKVTLKEGLVTIGDKAFKGCSSLTSITMPVTVQKIGNYAFENCTKLKTVKLNEGLLTIGKKAFYNCKALKKVKIPKSVLKIGSYAFAKCAALTSFTFATDSQLMSMGTGVLSNDKKLTKIKLPGKLTAVPSKAFKNDTKLASVTIGKSVTKIGAEAFNGCKKIKKVTIPTKVQTIGEKAFYNCKSLKTVSIKSKALTSVGEKAFKKCRKGLRIVVPGSKTASYKKLLNGKY